MSHLGSGVSVWLTARIKGQLNRLLNELDAINSRIDEELRAHPDVALDDYKINKKLDLISKRIRNIESRIFHHQNLDR